MTDPLGMTGRRFKTPASQGTLGNKADVPQGSQEHPTGFEPMTWQQTAEAMAHDALQLNTIAIPGQPQPTFWERFNYVFLGTEKRAYIVSAIVLLIALFVAFS